MNYFDRQKLAAFIAGEAMDEFPVGPRKHGLPRKPYPYVGKKHADGTPCKAATPDSCPFNKTAEEGDKIGDENKKLSYDEIEKIEDEISAILYDFYDSEYEALRDISGGDGGSSWCEEEARSAQKALENLWENHDWDGLDDFTPESGDDSTGPSLAYYGRKLEKAGYFEKPSRIPAVVQMPR